MSIDVSDLNNDSYPDIVVTNPGSNYVVVFLGAGDGTFTAQNQMFTGLHLVPQSVVVNDLNGDSHLDILFAY